MTNIISEACFIVSLGFLGLLCLYSFFKAIIPKPKPKELTKYNVGKIVAEIEFDDCTITKEFKGYVTKQMVARNGFTIPITVYAGELFGTWQKTIQKRGFIAVDQENNKQKHIPVGQIKNLITTYSDFTVEY